MEPTKKEDPVLRGKSWRPGIPRPLMPRRFRPRPNRYTRYRRTKGNFGERGRAKEVERGSQCRGAHQEESRRERVVKREGDKKRTGRYYRRDGPRTSVQEPVRSEASRYPRPPRSGYLNDWRSHQARVVNLLDTVAIGTGSGSLASERATQVKGSVHGDHLSQNLQALLGNSLIIDRDQVLGLGVDLEGLVEGKSSLDVVSACRRGRTELVIH